MRLFLVFLIAVARCLSFGQDGRLPDHGIKITGNEQLVVRPFSGAGPGGRPAPIKPYLPTLKLGRRDPKLIGEFELQFPKGTYDKPMFEVFSEVSYNIKTSATTPTNRVLVRPIDVQNGKVAFSINFANLLRRSSSKDSVFNSGLATKLGQQGHLTLFVCVERQHGEPSPFAKIEIGEPEPMAFKTTLEARTVIPGNPAPGKIVIAKETWGYEGPLDASSVLRWKTEATGASSYIVQLNQSGFSDRWQDWSLFGYGQALKSTPTNSKPTAEFAATDLFFVMPKPMIIHQDYYARIVPLDQYGNLAGFPSNTVKLSVPLYDINGGKAKPKPKSYVSTTLTKIDFMPENNIIDDTRFVITQDVPPGTPYYTIYKSLAGREPKKGVKLQIVPQTSDKSWYEAVGDAIGGAISDAIHYANVLKGYVEQVVDVVTTAILDVVSIPGTLANAGIKKAMQASGIPDSYIDKYEIIRNSPGYVASFAVHEEMTAENLTVGQARDRFFKMANQIGAKSGSFNGVPEVSPYLGQDPDYQYRPARLFVHFRAKASDASAAGQFSSQTAFSISCTNYFEDASYQLSNGQPLTGQLQVIDSQAIVPPIPDGAEVVVPIYLKFAANTSDPNWGRAWFSPKTSQWLILGMQATGLSTKVWSQSY